MNVRALVINRQHEVLLQHAARGWESPAGWQGANESSQEAVLRITREKIGVELPFFSKLLETDTDNWYLVALDRWPPARQDLQLVDIDEALRMYLEPSTRHVLEWFASPSEMQSERAVGREAAEA